jgi:hypothetical protein
MLVLATMANTDKLVIKKKHFDCSKCEQRVIYSYCERQYQNGQGTYATSIDDAFPPANCEVFAKLPPLKNKLYTELQACPNL